MNALLKLISLRPLGALFTWVTMDADVVIGKVVIDSMPDNDEACGELLLELVDYLPKRYPTLFTREGPDGIFNRVTGEHHTSLAGKKGTDALLVVSR